MRPHPVLVVEGDLGIRDAARDAATTAGAAVAFAEGMDRALAALADGPASVLLVDARLTGASPARFLEQVARARSTVVPVVVGGGPDAADLLDAGAFEVVPRPPTTERLVQALRRALRQNARLEALARADAERLRRQPLPPLVGRSEATAALRERLAESAERDDPLVLAGEGGTGRDLAARLVHALSSRRAGPFVRAAATSRTAIEPSLERAGGGVLFVTGLDRVAEDDLEAWARGAAEPSRDVRFIAAWGPEPEAIAARLGARWVRLPPLRARGRDAVVVAQRFVERICSMNALPVARLSPDVVAAIESHTWPGNFRELREAIEHAVIAAERGVIQLEHLPDPVRRAAGRSGGTPRRFREAKRRVVDSFERVYLEELLDWHHGNVTAAAEQAGMLRSALQRLLRKHALRSTAYRAPTPTSDS